MQGQEMDWVAKKDERPLWPHQIEVLSRVKDLPHFALFWEMGSGKTTALIHMLRNLEKTSLRRVLIFCPPIVVKNWRAEILMNGGCSDRVIPLIGPGELRYKTFNEEAWKNNIPQNKIFITNYETLNMLVFGRFLLWKPQVLVLDESHKLKDPRSKRTKLIQELADLSENRFLFSGTPVLNSPLDLFSQFKIMDQGKTFGRNFFVFRNRYFFDKNAGMPSQRHFPDWRLLPDAVEKINELIQPVVSRVKKSECLTLPPYVKKKIFVPLSPRQRKSYEEMKADLITYLQDSVCTASIALTKGLRLQQIVSGFLPASTVELDGSLGSVTHHFAENPRLQALSDLLLELTPNHKVIIWAVFRENYSIIRKILEEHKINYVEITGEISSVVKFKNVDIFNTDAKCRVLLGHPGSGGIGINLVSASYSIFYSRGFSLEYDKQAEARNYRGGSEIHESVTRIDLVAEDTIDEIILESLHKKEDIGEKTIQRLRESLGVKDVRKNMDTL